MFQVVWQLQIPMANVTHIDRTCFFLRFDALVGQKIAAIFYTSIGLNLFMAPLSMLFNGFVLFAILRTKALYTPSYIFIRSLIFSDFLVGAVVQPLYLAYKFAELNGDFSIYCITGALSLGLSYAFGGASYFTLTAISVDRCLALHLGKRYRPNITTSRVTKVTIAIWVFSCTGSSSQMFLSKKAFFRVVAVVMVLGLVVTVGAYIKSFKALKRHQAKIGTRSIPIDSEYSARNITKYRETLILILHIVLLFFFSYIPLLCVSVIIGVNGLTSETRAASYIATTINYVNSCLNPILYIWKLTDIRNACVDAARRVVYKKEINITKTEGTVQNVENPQGLPVPEM